MSYHALFNRCAVCSSNLGPKFLPGLWGRLQKQKFGATLEFVTCGVELLMGHCTDIPADWGSY